MVYAEAEVVRKVATVDVEDTAYSQAFPETGVEVMD